MNSTVSGSNNHQNSIYLSEEISGMSDVAKYNGMVPIPFLKRLRNNLFQIMSYLDNVVPRFYAIHMIISFFRIFQLYAPSILASYTTVYQSGSLTSSTIGIFSVFSHLFTPGTRPSVALFVLFSYSGLAYLFFFSLYFASTYYSANAKLPRMISVLISLYISTLGYISHPIAAQVAFEEIGSYISNRTHSSPFLIILASSLALSAFLIYLWLMANVTTISLQFRPDSLLSVQSGPVIRLSVTTICITSVLAFGKTFSMNTQVGLLIASILMYIYALRNLFHGATFVHFNHLLLLMSSILGSIVNCGINLYFLLTGTKANEAYLFILFCIFFLSYLISSGYLNHMRHGHFATLDAIENNKEEISRCKNVHHLLNMCLAGFSISHPICISWKIFQYGNETWENSVDILSVFAKFIAIYPEESRTLEWIQKTIISNKIKGSVAKLSVLQIRTILRQRESNLSPYLKKKISDLSKLSMSTKHKMRNIWDLVVQGNISEMENSIIRAYKSVEKAQMEFNHILTMFPNNRFVARPYAFFLREVKADQVGFAEWMEKIRLLKRGILISSDNTHDLGLLSFPLLPQVVNSHLSIVSMGEFDVGASTEVDLDDETIPTTMDMSSYIRTRINSVTIPSIRNSNTISLLLLFFVVLGPSIYLLLGTESFLNQLAKPLEFMHALSYMRCLNFQMSALGIRWIMEELPILGTNEMLFELVDYGSYLPQSLGGQTSTQEQLRYLLRVAPLIVQQANLFRSFEVGNPSLDIVRYYCFTSSIAYTYHTNVTSYYDTLLSAQEILMGSVLHLSKFVNEIPNESILMTPGILNPINNVHTAGLGMSEALLTLTKYLTSVNDNVQLTYNYFNYGYIIGLTLLYLIVVSVNLSSVSQQKIEIYKCLTSLPKSVVGSVVESLRTLKKEGTEASRSTEADSEVNKQEENILKIFTAASDSNLNAAGTQGMQIIAAVFIVICGITSITILCTLYRTESLLLQQSAPHIDYLLGTSAYVYGQFTALKSIVLPLMDYKQIDEDPFYINRRVYQRNLIMREYYNHLRFGGENGETPYVGIHGGLAKSKTYIECIDPKSVPTSNFDIFRCYDADTDIMLFDSMMLRIMHPYQYKYDIIRSRGDLVTESWFLGSIVIYDSYLYPMFDSVISNLKIEIENRFGSSITWSIILISLTVIFEIFIIIEAHYSKTHMMYCLSLLLHCPPSSISQSQKIMAILAGDFSSQSMDMTNRNSEFFLSVTENLPDSVLLVDQMNNIVTINRSCLRLFNIESQDYIYKTSTQFFTNERFGKDSNSFASLSLKPDGIHVSFKKSAEETVYLHATSINAQNFVIYTFRDESQTINYNMLIQEERNKSDKMLASILPLSLVPRVQAGERNISFAVQTASVIFIDIVEFTPWCSSNTASRVMSVLNTIFREFDALLPSYPTMSKIKCIGDCYMAAGGIFSDVNQPTRHAKEAVEFSLEAINVILKVNELMGENLKIRVGVNTGGPIVAGVLGTSKPTFEILGPAINMAQQMEHSGVPMNVHISRSVYELIYGGSYKIKERGQIAIKNGQVFTYLVTP